MEDVRLGTLDFTLTKPVDAQLLVSMRQIEVWKLIDVVVGLRRPRRRASPSSARRSGRSKRAGVRGRARWPG